MVVPVTSPSRRSIAAAESGASASAAAATSSDPNMKASNAINTVTLHLDLDDPADPEEPNRLHHEGNEQRHLAHAVLEEQLHVLRVEHRQDDAQRRRQGQQDEGGEAAVRGVHANLPADLESLADHVREVVENLGQIAAGFPLNQHGGDEEPDVEDRDALGHLVERIAERKTEVLLIERLLELGSHRLLQLLGHHAEGGLERVARAKSAGYQVEAFGEH